MEKNKTNSFLVIALIIFIALSVILGGYIVISKEQKEVAEKINLIDNFDDTINVGQTFHMGYKSKILLEENNEEVEEYYYGTYHYNGENKGKLIIDNKVIKLEGTIKDVFLVSGYDGFMYDATQTNEIEYVSKLYVLFEDGRIGKIDTNDIKNNNCEIKMLQEYNNIDYFIEVGPVDSGAAAYLYAVNKEGKAFAIDNTTPGA